MNHLRRRTPELSRERLVNPHQGEYLKRVSHAGATDLRGNFRLQELGGGYSRIVVLDPSRKVQE